MSAANGDRQGIRRIIRRRFLFQAQQSLCHISNLFFRCLTIPHYSLLHLQWRQFQQGRRIIFHRQQNDAAGLADRHCSRYIAVEKQFFHPDDIRPTFPNQFVDPFINDLQSFGPPHRWSGPDYPESGPMQRIPVQFNKSVAANRVARIDSHGQQNAVPLYECRKMQITRLHPHPAHRSFHKHSEHHPALPRHPPIASAWLRHRLPARSWFPGSC